jgi:hypothetical protein
MFIVAILEYIAQNPTIEVIRSILFIVYMKKKELIILSIDLGNNKDEIHVGINDTPLALAQEFCKKHELDKVAENSISRYISLELSKLSFTPQFNKSKTPQNLPETIPEEVKKLARGRSEPKEKPSVKPQPESKSPENPGERLYYQSLEKSRAKEEKIFKMLAERQANEINGLTFRPTINNTRLIKDRNKFEEDFLIKHKLLQEKLKSKQLEKAQEEMKDCTFHPSVNRSSSKIDKVKTSDRNLHLYYSAERTRKCPDRPKKKSPSKGNTTDRVNISQTVERLLKYKEKYEKNIESVKAQQMENEKYDLSTGKELFKPVINSPRAQRRRGLMSAGNSSITNLNLTQKSAKKIAEKVRLIHYEEVAKNK